MEKHWSKQLFAVHRITGLLAGAFLLLMSLSGSILVFTEEIDHVLYKTAYHVTPGTQRQPLQSLYQTTQQSLPGNPYLLFVKIPQQPDQSVVLRAEYKPDHKVYVFIDPYTGKILRQHSNTGYFTGWLLYLHFTLLSGTNGARVILIVGILLLLSLLTGTWIYRKAFGKVLRFQVKPEWHNRKRRWRNLHRIVGVWAILFNLLIVITGIMIELKVLDSRKQKEAKAVPIAATITFEQLLAKAQQAVPDFEAAGIRPPKKAGDPIRILGHTPGQPEWAAYSTSVFFDSNTGSISKITDFRRASFPEKLQAMVSPLHFGNYGGIPLKIIYCIFALTPGILSLSGFLIWFRRKYIIHTNRPGVRLPHTAGSI